MSFYRTITSINRQQQLRGFSTTVFRQSHIGSAPIYLTPDISCKVESIDNPRIVLKGRKSITLSQNIKIGGPRGELGFIVPDFVNVNINGPTAENNNIGKIQVSVNNTDDRIQRSMWGTVSATLRNNITGVTEGHLAILKLVGTGYRATIIDSVANPGKKHVSLKVGASDNQGLDVPDGLTVSSPVPTRVVIEGISKQQVKLFAANLRKFRPPEPYKGKGIFVDNETIKIKDKKIK
ncbi:mitochondrial 54S ribosomal protein YmL16 [Saccharomycopsis crataegensis]|uniref:Mitochondrial 54S ribosomal protein YmL16 n=1 Tax=Saccharomycopsis crataegensis TaxID=43959 RepID=A0AAV5QLB9_9ASCO|nr:mitochondrial 54S ribosomal protein YmL16 [Saccharomycopsis crataegensis]